MDRVAFLNTDEEYHLFHVHDEVIKRQQNILATNYRDPEVDFDCQIIVLPYGKRRTYWVLGLLYTEQDELRKIVETQSWYENYAYWDNCDEPEHVTRTQLERRKQDWERVLGQKHSGFAVQLVKNQSLLPSRAMVVAYQPPVAFRAKRLAEQVLLDRWLEKHGQPENAATFYRTYMKFARSTLNPDAEHYAEYRRTIQDFQARIKPFMPEDI